MAFLENSLAEIKGLHNSGLFHAAAELAGSRLRENPSDGRIWELLGIACHGMRDFELATRALEMATLLVPLSASAQVALASCYLRADQHDVARSMYQHLASIRKRLPNSLLSLVISGLLQLGETGWAFEVARERAEREPESDDAVFAVAHYMRLSKHPPKRILPVAYHAFQLDPQRVRNRVLLAILYHECGQLMDAYRLATAIDIGRLVSECCPRRLTSLIALFGTMGDATRRDVCRARLEQALQAKKPKSSRTRESS